MFGFFTSSRKFQSLHPGRIRRIGASPAMLLPLILLLSGTPGGSSLSAGTVSRGQRSRPLTDELDIAPTVQKTTATTFGPKRTTPVYTGPFSVGCVIISFPDTQFQSLEDLKGKLLHFGPMSVADYFKEYSQGITWPELFIIGEQDYDNAVYKAPKPKGYYCEYDFWSNPIGYQGDEGGKRAAELRAAARQHAYRYYKRPKPPIPVKADGMPDKTCYVFMVDLKSPEEFKTVVRPYYGDRKLSYDQTKEAWPGYGPAINWADPLWPNSLPQVFASGGGVMCHELGHVLGAPDYYHVPEKFDGVPGTPCLSWAYGPTGPGYCRVIYNAFLKSTNYPTYTKSGTYSLVPRKTNPAGRQPVGCFILSNHPNYLYYLEYVKDEAEPLGNPGRQGLLAHVINVTLTSPGLGGPDLCYTYRPGDPHFRSEGTLNDALFGEASGRTSFDMTTDPSSRLPNLLDGGLALTNIVETSSGVTFTVNFTPKTLTPAEVKASLTPKVILDGIDEVLPTSFHARCTIGFRGEPMKQDYGFCWSATPKPTIHDSVFPLYHRDRYEARILNLSPGTKYYVRAYARNSVGVSYSERQLRVTTLATTNALAEVPPLLSDKYSNCWFIERTRGNACDASGAYIGAGASVTLLKLTAYYRASFSKEVPPYDLTRLHTSPTLERPGFRMKEFQLAYNDCCALAQTTGMQALTFGQNFDRDFRRAFQLKYSMGTNPVQEFSEENAIAHIPRIRRSLMDAKPVVVALQSGEFMTPRKHCLSWLIIDGYQGENDFHVVYHRDHDRDFNQKTGWYTLDKLFQEVTKARIIFNFVPATGPKARLGTD